LTVEDGRASGDAFLSNAAVTFGVLSGPDFFR
jgi:hypothetical protein